MNVTAASIAQVAIPFVWLGLVVGISFIEAPLKFRAPGLTLAVGLGIGRLVFRVLNTVEVILALALTLGVIAGGGVGESARFAGIVLGLVILLWLLLILQAGILRPRMDTRAKRIGEGEQLPGSSHHYFYIGAELIKAVALPVLGVLSLIQLVG